MYFFFDGRGRLPPGTWKSSLERLDHRTGLIFFTA
jgi:hypothetical protein